MAFGTPLKRTFGVDVLNAARGDDFRPDDVITASQLRDALANGDHVIVYETQTASGKPLDERLAGSGLTITRLGEKTSAISLLSQSPRLGDWTKARIHVVVFSVTASAG
jgi:hypothetical protein